MKKRFMSVVMAMLMLVGFITSAACGKETSPANVDGTEIADEVLTREQWIIGLGSAFGMNDYVTEQAFFTDVDSTEEVYPFLQSCAEWGIFEKTGGKFDPQGETTRAYAVQTAVIASEVLKNITDDSIYKECISYAEKKGILTSDKKDYLAESITYEEGQKILDWAVDEYQNREFVEYYDVEMNEEIIDMTSSNIQVDENTVVIPEGNQELHEGDVFITPATIDAPDGVAEKVASVSYDENGKQIVETVDPELQEIYNKLDFAVRAVPEASDIIVSDGVTLASVDDGNSMAFANATTCDLSDGLQIETDNYNSANNRPLSAGSSYGFEVNFTKGSVKLNPSWETSFGKFKADLEEQEPETQPGDKKAGELFEKSSCLYENKADGSRVIDKIDNKFTGGYEITGSLAIKNLYIDVEAHSKKVAGVPVGIEDFAITTNYDTESTLKLKGNLKEELTISTFHIQTPVPGLTVKLEVILYANADGELEIKFKTSSVNTLSYSDGKIKKVNTSTADAPDITMAIKIECGAAIKAAPCILGKEITDVKIKGGIGFEFKPDVIYEDRTVQTQNEILTIRSWIWKIRGTKTFPIVKLEVGSSKKCLLKLNMSWELVGEKGLVKVQKKEFLNKRYDIGEDVIDREKIEDTQQIEDTETKLEEDKVTEQSEENEILEGSNILDIDSYMISVNVGTTEKITVSSLPEGYTEADLIWESENPEIATVKGGKVTGISTGSTQIKVSTSDGTYSVNCTVIVSDDEEVEFHSL